LAATRNETVPSPCPVAADVSWIQDAWLVAVHVHSRVIAIVSVPVPPSAPKLDEELAIVG